MSDEVPPEAASGSPGKDPKDQLDSRSDEEGLEGDHLQVVQAKLVAIDEYTRGIGFLKTIAGITAINVILGVVGIPVRIVFGLVSASIVTLFAQALGLQFGMALTVLGVGLALAMAGFYWMLGVLGLDRKRWAIYAGMSLYLLDLLPCLYFGLYLEVACHLYALHLVGSGLGGLGQLERLEAGEVPA